MNCFSRFVFAAVVGLLASGETQAAPPPNIVVIVSDDMGAHQPGFQGGNEGATPNLDRLAAHGTQLTQFYVHATCTPTRAALLTGRYAFRTGTEERFHANDTAGMLTDERTLAQALHDAGYFTAIVGKWHLGEWQKKHLPRQRGFDHQYGSYGAVIDSFTHDRGGVYDWHRNEQPLNEEGYSSFLIADEFARLIEAHDPARPFFIYAAFNAVHVPHDAPAEYVERFGGDKQLAMLACLDVAVGRIVDALAHKGVLDNTLIVYLNDNGGPKRIGNGPWRGFKKTTYEGGVRVPCVCHWPGHVPSGAKLDSLLHVTDLYPTLVNLAGGSLEQPLPLDGHDVWATLTDGQTSPRDEVVLSVPGHEDSETGPPAIRVGNYKWVDGELYDVAHDPSEQENLADKQPEIAARLLQRLNELAAERRTPEPHGKVAGERPTIKGEDENENPPAWLAERPVDEQPHRRKRDRD